MPSTFPILRTVSSKGNRAQITVRFGKLTVTRHIIDGQGKHPDDSLPKRYENGLAVIASLRIDVEKLNKVLAAIDKEIETNGPEVDSARIAQPAYIAARLVANLALLEHIERYQTELAENPLFVTFTS